MLKRDEIKAVLEFLQIEGNNIAFNYDDTLKTIQGNLGRIPLDSETIALIMEYIENQIK